MIYLSTKSGWIFHISTPAETLRYFLLFQNFTLLKLVDFMSTPAFTCKYDELEVLYKFQLEAQK